MSHKPRMPLDYPMNMTCQLYFAHHLFGMKPQRLLARREPHIVIQSRAHHLIAQLRLQLVSKS
jgi:hypothetical protein